MAPAVEAETVGVRLRPGIPREAWEKALRQVGRRVRMDPWIIGDLAFFGEGEYGATLEEIAAITGLTRETVRSYSWVAGRFAHERRRASLSLQHHMLVAGWGSDTEQDEWLDRAEAEGWSRDEMGRILRATKQASQPRKVVPRGENRRPAAPLADEAQARELILRLEPEREHAWLSASEAAGLTLEEWVEGVVDEAAEHVPLEARSLR